MNERRASRIEANVGGERRALTGFLVADSETTIIFARHSDFRFSGIVVLNKVEAGPVTMERDDVVIFFKKVVDLLGLNSIDIVPKEYSEGSMIDALKTAMNSRRIVVVEGKNSDEIEIGRINAVSEDQAVMARLNSDGTWEQSGARLKIRNVAALTILDPYCNSLEEYVAMKDN